LFYLGLTTFRDVCATVEINEIYRPHQTQGSPGKAVALHPSTFQSMLVKGLNVRLERVSFGRVLNVKALNVWIERLPFACTLAPSVGCRGKAASNKGGPK